MSDRIPDPNPTPDLVPLIGVRELCTSEPEGDAACAEALIKRLTDGAPCEVREITGEWIEIDPEFSLRISGPHKPDSRDPEQ